MGTGNREISSAANAGSEGDASSLKQCAFGLPIGIYIITTIINNGMLYGIA